MQHPPVISVFDHARPEDERFLLLAWSAEQVTKNDHDRKAMQDVALAIVTSVPTDRQSHETVQWNDFGHRVGVLYGASLVVHNARIDRRTPSDLSLQDLLAWPSSDAALNQYMFGFSDEARPEFDNETRCVHERELLETAKAIFEATHERLPDPVSMTEPPEMLPINADLFVTGALRAVAEYAQVRHEVLTGKLPMQRTISA